MHSLMSIRLSAACALLAVAAACQRKTVVSAPSPSPTSPAPAPSVPTAVPGTTASAVIHDAAGTRVGSATFTDTYSGILITGQVTGLGLGQHGVHIHAVGKCEPPFTTAGGHFNPAGRQHGFRNP